ncbi:DUF3822 family protein [Jiulongibacter sp. NS-SX5]|uniref:DUF3822 family protein n=1 Tax=Jiulongibacter sp. NS-SX5 TaxID=3463854 RepID=UPI0040586C7A
MIKENIQISSSYSVKDDRFEIEHIPESTLICEISDSFFRFIVKDKRSRIVWLEDFPIYPQSKNARIKQLFEDHTLLSARFWKDVIFLIHGEHKTFVPAELDAKHGLSLLQQLSNSSIESAHITKTENGSFAVNSTEDLLQLLKDYRQDKPAKIVLADSVLEKPTIIFHRFGVSLFTGGQSSNIYHAKSFEDFLRLIEDFEIKPIEICGEVTEYALEYKQLKARLPQVSLAQQVSGIQFSQYFQECPKHRYFLLFCASKRV